MKIYLHEITDNETELDFTQEEKWVSDAVARVDEKYEGEFTRSASKAPQVRPIESHFSLRKVDDVVVINGDLRTHVQLVCSRCANYFPLKCDLNFSGLFCKDPVMAGVAHLQRQGTDKREPGRPVGQNKGFARHQHDFDSDETVESGRDLDITYISNDFIDLADVLTEQLQLQVPFQPLCQENCKGMCAQCGADLNVGRCACAKLATTRPFSVLRDFKVKAE